MTKLSIKVSLSAQAISNLLASAIEGGDPVTCAYKGGWCNGIGYIGEAEGAHWYCEENNFKKPFAVTVIEVDDESTGHETTHRLNKRSMDRGASVMAEKFSHLFQRISDGNIDAPCADIFLQCCCFGEEKYA